MRELIIHIGWPKTGTSSIQRILAGSSEALRNMGILYPTVGRWSDAHHRVCGFLIEHDDPLIPSAEVDVQQFRHMSDGDCNSVCKIVLSSEGFCRALRIKEGASQVLNNLFHVRVLAAFREPVFWANSLLNELVKSQIYFQGRVDLLELGRRIIVRDIAYSERLRIWAEAFGRDSITVVTLNEGEDFVQPLLNGLGIDAAQLPAVDQTSGRNASYGLEALRLITWLVRSERHLSHAQKVELSARLKVAPVESTLNILPSDLEQIILESTPSISKSLSIDWLDGRTPFENSHRLPDAKSLDEITRDTLDLARYALRPDSHLLEALLNDIGAA